MAIPSKFGELLEKISDQGEKFNKLDSPKCRYYAFLSKIEDVSPKDMPIEDQTWAALFEIVPYEWIESLPEEIWESKSPLPISPASLIETDETKASDFAEALNAKVGEIDEGDWYILEDIEPLEEGSPRPAETVSTGKVVKGIRSGGDYKRKGVPTNVKGGPAPVNKRQKLRDKFPSQDPIFIESLIIKQMGNQIPHAIGVMDVGQAACNLVYDRGGNPIFYSDAGFPTHRYEPSAQNNGLLNPGPCLVNNPFVVLSHWDLDHCLMVERSLNTAELSNLLWVVPHQPLGAVGNNIFSRLQNVHVWPANRINPLQSTNNRIKILKCNGNTMNDSGLAVAVNTGPDGDERWVLLPGDATFQYIQGVADVAYDWITAPHHGSNSKLDTNRIPRPRANNPGRIAYSYGIMTDNVTHCYNHPSQNAIQKYISRGWGAGQNQVSSTAERGPRSGENPRVRGNIMMCNNIAPAACGRPDCPFRDFKVFLL
jgi:hypothetical protein